MALPSVRLQQLKHLLVGAAAGVADLDGQVEVADGEGLGATGVRCSVSAAAVHGPIPGGSWSRIIASGKVVSAASSRRGA